MSNQSTPKKDDDAAEKVIRSDNFVSTYINNARIGISKWDIGLSVGHLDARRDGTTLSIESVFLQMTPAYARALGEDLLMSVKQYEEMYGIVGRPPNETAAIASKKKP